MRPTDEPTTPGRARPRAAGGRSAAGVRSAAIIVTGALIDICAIVNVPGAADLPRAADGDVSVTGLGGGLALLVVFAWGSVLWRRKHPLVPVIAGGVLAAIGISYLLLLVGAVAYANAHPARLRRIGLLIGSGVALFVVREALTPWGGALPWFFASSGVGQGEPAWVIASIVIAAVALAVAAGVVYALRARTRVQQSDVRAEQEQRRADALNEQMVRQAERERIARDMHDALAHRLSVVSLHAGALEAAGMTAGGDAGEIARTVREQTHAALEDMRGLIGDLRSGPGEASPATMRAVGALLSDLRAGGVQITAYVVIEAPERATAQFDSAVHRIVQEALTNALKHGNKAPIDVFVQVGPPEGARIRVVNGLRPHAAPLAPGGGHGTIGIRERAVALGGTAWIGAHEGTFIVDVTLPWQERAVSPG